MNLSFYRERISILVLTIRIFLELLELYIDIVNTLCSPKVYIPPSGMLLRGFAYCFCSHTRAYVSVHSKLSNTMSAC